jgi:hypothetical protein
MSQHIAHVGWLLYQPTPINAAIRTSSLRKQMTHAPVA